MQYRNPQTSIEFTPCDTIFGFNNPFVICNTFRTTHKVVWDVYGKIVFLKNCVLTIYKQLHLYSLVSSYKLYDYSVNYTTTVYRNDNWSILIYMHDLWLLGFWAKREEMG